MTSYATVLEHPPVDDREIIQAYVDLTHALIAPREGAQAVDALVARQLWIERHWGGSSVEWIASRLGLSSLEITAWMVVASPWFDDRLVASDSRLGGGEVPASVIAELVRPLFPGTTAFDLIDDTCALRRFALFSLGGTRARPTVQADPALVRVLIARDAGVSLSRGTANPIERHRDEADRIAELLAARPEPVAIVGPRGSGRTTLAHRVGALLGRPLVATDLTGIAATTSHDVELLLRTSARSARLCDGMLCVKLGASDHGKIARSVLDDCGVAAVLTGDSVIVDTPGLPTVTIGPLELDQVPEFLEHALSAADLDPGEIDPARLQRPGMTPGDVACAAATVAASRRIGDTSNDLTQAMSQALDDQLSVALSGVASRIPCQHDFDDLVVTPPVMTRLRELVSYVEHGATVFRDWGFARHGGGATTALFAGPPGTGKTMAAGVVARAIGRELYRIDLSQVVSKYIGETEKNLARVFAAAARGGAVLLFDEADALFAKRTEVKSSNDRHANLEVNFLLQQLETFDGIAILTTNFLKNIDDAFRRRLRFIIDFAAPSADERRSLWRSHLPPAAPLAGEMPWDMLASLDLSGGGIRNATLRAAFAAAARQDAITAEDLLRAGAHELEAMGRLAPDLTDLIEASRPAAAPDPSPADREPEPAPDPEPPRPIGITRQGGLRPLLSKFPFANRRSA